MRPQSEFRCFVCNDRLMGISQRDVTQFYPQLQGEEESIKQRCSTWFDANVKGVFELGQCEFRKCEKCEMYVDSMDVYLTSKGKIKLIDFNAICSFSSSLLFTWEELNLTLENEDSRPSSSE